MKKYWWIWVILILIVVGVLILLRNDKKNNKYKIGILQYVEHESLDLARNGFMDHLNEMNIDVNVDYKNAQGEQSNCILIANQFVSDKKDLILAIATPAAQAISKATLDIPILVTAVTNPQETGIVKSNENPLTNVSGTSDLGPIEKQLDLVKIFRPNAKNVGIIYSSGESNSKYQVEIAQQKLKNLGLNPVISNFSNSTEILSVIESISQKIDVFFAITDNMIASNIGMIVKKLTDVKVPIICWDRKSVENGGTGSYAIDYYELGKSTAKQAIKILNKEIEIQNMPIEFQSNPKLFLNGSVINKFGIKLPEEILKKAEILE